MLIGEGRCPLSILEEDRAAPDDLTKPADNEINQLGVYKSGFPYREEALRFFRSCVGEEQYERAMNSEAGKQHHYVAARAFLSQADWEKFVWIEEHGSLTGFPK